MSTTYVVGVRIDGNSAGYLRATQLAQQGTRQFVNMAKAEYDRLRNFMRSTQGQLAGLGVGVGFLENQKMAAIYQRDLLRVGMNADATKDQLQDLRAEIDRISTSYGVAASGMSGAVGRMVASGLNLEKSKGAIEAIGLAVAVTGENIQKVTAGVLKSGTMYDFDLSNAKTAMDVADKMRVAGKLGNAEMGDLSDIFGVVAPSAKKANLSFEQALAFTEALSTIKDQPEQLRTLADSTLRIFTNGAYSAAAQKATGVPFFDKKTKMRRDPIEILGDMQKKFATLTTDLDRFNFTQKAFGKADLDTQLGLSELLSGTRITWVKNATGTIQQAPGTLKREAPQALGNAASQAERLRETMQKAGREFAQPVNEAVANAVKYMLDSKAQGGLGASGGQLIGGAVAGVGAAYLLSRIVPGIVGTVLNRTAGVAQGVAQGKALQAAAGITPVYVTNWAEMNGGGSGLGAAAAGAATGAAATGAAASAMGAAAVSAATLGAIVAVGAPILAAGALISNRANNRDGLRERIADRDNRLAELTALERMGGTSAAMARLAGEKARLQRDRDALMSRMGTLDGGGSGVRGQGFNDPRIIGSATSAAALQEVLRSAEIKGEISVRVTAAPGLQIETSQNSGNPRIPMKAAVGQTNLGAGY